jgi:hypothetical protein
LPYLAEKNHVNYNISLKVQSCYIEASFYAIINFIEIKLIVVLFFSKRFELSPKIIMMHQLSQRLISSISKYPGGMEGATRTHALRFMEKVLF